MLPQSGEQSQPEVHSDAVPRYLDDPEPHAVQYSRAWVLEDPPRNPNFAIPRIPRPGYPASGYPQFTLRASPWTVGYRPLFRSPHELVSTVIKFQLYHCARAADNVPGLL